MNDINFLFGALRYFFNVIWGALIVIGWFTLGVFILGYIWYRVERRINKKLTQPFREAMERKNIKVVDGRSNGRG